MVPSDWHGETEFRKDLDAQAAHLKDVAAADASSASQKAKSALSSAEKEAKKLGSDASAEAKKLSRKGKKELERPEVQLGLIGVVNAVVIVGVGYAAWRNWDQRRWDRRVVSATVIGLGALFGSQGCALFVSLVPGLRLTEPWMHRYFGWLFYGKDKK